MFNKRLWVWIFRILAVLGVILVLLLIVPFPAPARVPTPAYQLADLQFPSNFFWGSATAAHQVEGNTNNSLTQWEKDNAQRLASEAEAKLKSIVPDWDLIKGEATDPNSHISGIADDQYHLYNQDIDLMKQIGLNSYRFSIEWSRIEPQPGQFDTTELDHYRTEIQALKAAGISPFVTLWHRTDPVWVEAQGEWENPKTIADYQEYVKTVVTALGPDVKYWMTFNEPVLHVVSAYVQGNLPPEVKDQKRGETVLKNMAQAHNQIYSLIHQLDSDAQVGSTQAMQIAYGSPNTFANQVLTGYLNNYANWEFLDLTRDQNDFIGIQYYGPTLFALDFGGQNLVSVKNFPNTAAAVRSDSGVEVYPHGIYELIKASYERYQKPIIVTENGIANIRDDLRAKYIADHLYWVHEAIKQNIPVLGYFYWSLLDNFEWDSGYWPHFGLIKVDRTNLSRTILPSADTYRQIIKNGK